MGDRHLVLGFQSRSPETAAQLHLLVVHLHQPLPGRHISLCASAGKTQGQSEKRALKSTNEDAVV